MCSVVVGCDWSISVVAAVVYVVIVYYQAATVLCSGLWTHYDVERLTAELWR